ncbi:hypothetical protein C8J57DRAFT_1538166 [Mycena rebaudengoi]|nr:hypothetical protein C8J57DRAFT_1543982 [Mycena rebaudengoi]KAJ7215761.1 hypothetical protein C8J57DRAFT_1538166 [Mycena rebaudengoi]
MSDNQESLLLPELPAPPTTILVSIGWVMLDYVRYNIARAIPRFLCLQTAFVYLTAIRGKKIINMDREDGARLSEVNTGHLYSLLFHAVYYGPSISPPYGVVHVPTANDVHSPVPLNDDVVREILHRLDIVALSHYGLFSKAHAATALGLLKERVKCYTLPFCPDERAWTTFFEPLEEFESWINGSVPLDSPLEALSLQIRPEVPTNLNVLLSHVHELNWANND